MSHIWGLSNSTKHISFALIVGQGKVLEFARRGHVLHDVVVERFANGIPLCAPIAASWLVSAGKRRGDLQAGLSLGLPSRSLSV